MFRAYFEMWRSWGRFGVPSVADEARKKEWQQLGDWQVSHANEDRALVATGSVLGTKHRENMKIPKSLVTLAFSTLYKNSKKREF